MKLKKPFIAISFFLMISSIYSQDNNIQLVLTATDTLTDSSIEFNATIINKSDKYKKVVGLNMDCNSYVVPVKWTIQVKNKELGYEYIFPIVIAYGQYTKYHRIKKGKIFEVRFCLDFSKQAPIDNQYNLNDYVKTLSNDSTAYYFSRKMDTYTNDAFGKYKVKLLYDDHSNHEKMSIKHLESNIVSIEYTK
jgi:hypothetical protein